MLRATAALILVASACVVPVPPARTPERPEPPADCPQGPSLELLRIAARERGRRRLPPLEPDLRLQAAAQLHAEDMARQGVSGHTGSDGSAPADRVERFGYPYRVVAENVGGGFPDAAAMFEAWMDSPGHRANLLAGDVRHAGVGYAFRADTRARHHWVMVFGDAPDRMAPAGSCGAVP